MTRMFARHTVDDYDTWRKAYDDFDGERDAMGVTAHGVYRGAANGQEITLFHDFEDLAAAEAFANSPRLMEVMKDAGVQGKPDIWMGEHHA